MDVLLLLGLTLPLKDIDREVCQDLPDVEGAPLLLIGALFLRYTLHMVSTHHGMLGRLLDADHIIQGGDHLHH